MYTVKEFAELMKVSEQTIYNWVNYGKIAFVRTPGGHIRIPREAVPKPEVAVPEVGDGGE